MDTVINRVSQDRPHLSPGQFDYRAGIGTDHFPFVERNVGCRGFKGPSPSTTLDKDVVLYICQITLAYQREVCQFSPKSGSLQLSPFFLSV